MHIPPQSSSASSCQPCWAGECHFCAFILLLLIFSAPASPFCVTALLRPYCYSVWSFSVQVLQSLEAVRLIFKEKSMPQDYRSQALSLILLKWKHSHEPSTQPNCFNNKRNPLFSLSIRVNGNLSSVELNLHQKPPLTLIFKQRLASVLSFNAVFFSWGQPYRSKSFVGRK